MVSSSIWFKASPSRGSMSVNRRCTRLVDWDASAVYWGSILLGIGGQVLTCNLICNSAAPRQSRGSRCEYADHPVLSRSSACACAWTTTCILIGDGRMKRWVVVFAVLVVLVAAGQCQAAWSSSGLGHLGGGHQSWAYGVSDDGVWSKYRAEV